MCMKWSIPLSFLQHPYLFLSSFFHYIAFSNLFLAWYELSLIRPHWFDLFILFVIKKKIQVALKSPSDSEKHSPSVLHNGCNPPPVDRAGSHPKKHRNDNQCCSSVHVFKTMHNHWEPHFEVSVLLDRWGNACTPSTLSLANGLTPSLPFHRAHFH